MLVRFAVENFLSFGPRWELDLHGPGHPLPDGTEVLALALICGGSGHGKSNLLKAFSYLRQILLHGNRPGQRPQLAQCRLLEPPEPATSFELTLVCEGVLFRYALTLRAEQIDSESLWRQATGEPESLVFVRERKNPILQLTDVKVGAGAGSDRGLLESLALTLSLDQPLLSEALASDCKAVTPIARWFTERLQLVRPEPRVTGLAARCARHPDFADRLGELLRAVGLPVSRVSARKTPIGPDYFENEAEQKHVVQALLGYSDGFVQTNDGELIADREGNFVDLFLTSLLVAMRGSTGRESDFSPAELSESTLRLLHLSPIALSDPQHAAPVFVVDDLGRGLDGKVLSTLLEYPERPRDGQLLATALADSMVTRAFPSESLRRLP